MLSTLFTDQSLQPLLRLQVVVSIQFDTDVAAVLLQGGYSSRCIAREAIQNDAVLGASTQHAAFCKLDGNIAE